MVVLVLYCILANLPLHFFAVGGWTLIPILPSVFLAILSAL